MQELELIKRDFLEIVDFDKTGLDEEMKRTLLKAAIKNFFDYLAEKIERI